MPAKNLALLGALCVGASLSWGCSAPSFDVPNPAVERWPLELEPGLDSDEIALSFRGRVKRAPITGRPWLLRGELSEHYARAVRIGQVPGALKERAVPLRYWRDGDDCIFQPTAWLQPGEAYALAFEGIGKLRDVRARAAVGQAAKRIFPPVGRRKRRVAIFCEVGEQAVARELTLEPGGIPLRVRSGVAGVPNAGCLTLTSERELERSAVAPPLLGDSLLEPSLWQPGSSEEGKAVCSAGTLLADACVQVLDDRVVVTPSSDDQLWSLSAPQSVRVALSARARSTLLKGLSAETSLPLRGAVLSGNGMLQAVATTITTGQARRHLVLNEVLANPIGAEAQGEWIELWNDSELPVALTDLWLEDAGGSVPLPAATLAAGELALLVADDFEPSALDAPLPESVRLLRLASLGTRGLSNGGDALLLVGPEGVLSRFPLVPAPHAGRSIARRNTEAADDDPSAFAEQTGRGASPGSPNEFDSEPK